MNRMKWICLFCAVLVFINIAGCASTPEASETTVPSTTAETMPPATLPQTLPPETLPPETIPETTEAPQPVLELTDEEQALLLQIGMAERNAGLGYDDCPQCIALVMRTVLNRVESGRFSKTIRGVIYAAEQFTPVMDGSFDSAVPNDACFEALDMVIFGWDESQGALYYEFCDGPSWHSQNLNLLFQHCNTRFYTSF